MIIEELKIIENLIREEYPELKKLIIEHIPNQKDNGVRYGGYLKIEVWIEKSHYDSINVMNKLLNIKSIKVRIFHLYDILPMFNYHFEKD